MVMLQIIWYEYTEGFPFCVGDSKEEIVVCIQIISKCLKWFFRDNF